MRRLFLPMLALAAVAVSGAARAADLPGTQGAACAAEEAGPALKVLVEGLKDHRGLVRLELYPADDKDFLADDTVLLKEGKVFRRVDIDTPASADQAEMCIRAPVAGRYSVVVLHDRNGDRKFDPFVDGVGFPNNPKLGFSKPKAAAAAINIGPGTTTTAIVLNYFNGLSIGPHRQHRR